MTKNFEMVNENQSKILDDIKYPLKKIEIENDDLYYFSKWSFFLAETPKQNNQYDCGVFLCKFIEYVYKQIPFNFSQKDMKFFRYQIAEKLLK